MIGLYINVYCLSSIHKVLDIAKSCASRGGGCDTSYPRCVFLNTQFCHLVCSCIFIGPCPMHTCDGWRVSHLDIFGEGYVSSFTNFVH